MARHNIYIRQENEEAWQKSSKSDWINEALENAVPLIDRPPYSDKRPMVKKVYPKPDLSIPAGEERFA